VLQVIGQRRRRLVAAGRLLLQTLQADCLQIDVDGGVESPGPFGLLLQDQEESFERRFGLERRPPGQERVKDGTEAVSRFWAAACSGAM
jgi:hypothetical protein